MAKSNYPVNPVLTAIALAYRNRRMIADDVLPRVDVDKQAFKYQEYALGEAFTVPNTRVGRSSAPNQVEFGATEKTSSTEDFALDAPVPFADIANESKEQRIKGRATEQTTNLILLDREVRTAKLVFNPASYATDKVKSLTGEAQWSHEKSDPIEHILAGLDAPVMRPNVMVLGQRAATALRRNKAIVKAYHGSLGDSGLVPLEFLRELFELEEILVGQALVNTTNQKNKVTLAQAWGNHCSLIYRDKLADNNQGATFGFTGEWGSRQTWEIADEDMGMRGGVRIRVGESVKELVVAKELGYFLKDVAA